MPNTIFMTRVYPVADAAFDLTSPVRFLIGTIAVTAFFAMALVLALAATSATAAARSGLDLRPEETHERPGQEIAIVFTAGSFGVRAATVA